MSSRNQILVFFYLLTYWLLSYVYDLRYEKGAYMFGRVDLCDFVLEHPTISRFHAGINFSLILGGFSSL